MDRHTIADADAFANKNGKDETFIPKGLYCYSDLVVSIDGDGTPRWKANVCPYWSMDLDREEQSEGYCAFLGEGDWEDNSGASLLWDQVKECGVKIEIEEEGYVESEVALS